MEPKFQSSFIPKGSVTSTSTGVLAGRKIGGGKSLLPFLAWIVFIISVLSAAGVFGYKFYLKHRIEIMGADLETARAALEPDIISELTRLNNRIISTKELVSKHHVLTPLFEFLEVSTPKTVRFSDFSYSVTPQGLELHMRGEARGYAALALQADIFSESQYFKDPVFSELNLNDRGDVNFSFKTIIDPSLVSYERRVERTHVPVVSPTGRSLATSTVSTSSPQATSTQN